MSIQVIYHNYASRLPIGTQTNSSLKPGQVAAIGTSGEVKLFAVASYATVVPFGLIGDIKSTASASTFYNRVSDFNDETAASGYCTVYHGGGEFYIDINAGAGDTDYATGDVVNDSSVSAGDSLVGYGTGQLQVNNSATYTYDRTAATGLIAVVVDPLTTDSGKLPTGIPNEWEPSGNSDLPKKWCHIKLML